MNELKFNSQVCTTKEQSQHLLDLGLEPETADMEIEICKTDYSITGYVSKRYWEPEISEGLVELIPAWSLHRLMEIGNFVNVAFLDVNKAYKVCIDNIEEQIRFGIINKEYLISK